MVALFLIELISTWARDDRQVPTAVIDNKTTLQCRRVKDLST